MDKILLVRYGEIILKGNNRRLFENKLVQNIRYALRDEDVNIKRDQARIYIEPVSKDCDIDNLIKKTIKVFGVVSVSPAVRIPCDYDLIKKIAVELLEDKLKVKTFKVQTRRANKDFPLTSPEVCREVGAHILDKLDYLTVDVNNPNAVVSIEIRDLAYVYTDIIPSFGGLPVGTNGKALLLISGGIDSPVAGWMMAKRGVEVDAIHFFSPPYTGPKAKEKVIDLCRIMASYSKRVNLYVVPFTEPQLQIRDKCPEGQLTIIMRRIMMEIANRLAKQIDAQSLITGENIGQVASQTMHALVVTDEIADMPVFRPLIGMDKNDIINIARKIGTYETSILPFEDCCTVFVPSSPETKPRLNRIKQSEAHLDIEKLVTEAMNNIELIKIEE